MPNLGLLGITLKDQNFFNTVSDGAHLCIDFNERVIKVGDQKFLFELSKMERELFEHGGIESAFLRFGKQLFEVMTSSSKVTNAPRENLPPGQGSELQW